MPWGPKTDRHPFGPDDAKRAPSRRRASMGAAGSLLGASNTLCIQARNPASNAQPVDESDDASKGQLPARSSVDGHLGAPPRADLPHPGLTSDPCFHPGQFFNNFILGPQSPYNHAPLPPK